MGFHNFSSRRSSVLSCNGAVATSDPIASEVGLRILKDGGNAADAAVAIAAVLNLVDPGSTGLGGDCFVLFYDSITKTVKGINGSGRSPASLTLELLKKDGISLADGFASIPTDCAHSMMVPGAAAAWLDTIEMFGSNKLSVSELFQPAITLARNGYPVHEFSAYLQQTHQHVLEINDHSYGGDLLANNHAPKHGEVICNPNYANVLEVLSTQGKKGFYEGDIAKSIVHTNNAAGGCLTLGDMKEHSSTFDEPISTVYRGIRVWEMPPNGQGIVALMGLNILEGFDMKKEDRLSTSCLHKMIESTQLAFADGFKHIADPSKQDVPVDFLLSKERSEERRQLIQPNRTASAHYHPPTVNMGDDTVYFSVVDSHGNACSFINSVYNYYGCGLVPKDCGFVLQSRANNFSLDKNHPNCVEPRKRSYHTIIPGMATHACNDELYACFGVMGGFMQPQGHLQVLSNLIDFDMEPQVAICQPRFNINHFSNLPPVVCLEDSIPQGSIDGLKELGHSIKIVSGMERIMFGRGQIIQVKKDCNGKKVLWCGSEGRADGCAIGY